jgi:hypothetical protein
MIRVRFRLVYDMFVPPEVSEVEITLARGPWSDASEFHSAATNWIRCRDYLELTDANGETWSFHRGTILWFAAWGKG